MNLKGKINEIAIKYFDDNNSRFASEMETSEANIRNYRSGTQPKLEFLKKLSEKLELSFENLVLDSLDIEKSSVSSGVVSEPEVTYQSYKDELIATQKKYIAMLEKKLAEHEDVLIKKKKAS